MTTAWLETVVHHSGVTTAQLATAHGQALLDAVKEASVGTAFSALAWGRVLAAGVARVERTLLPARLADLALVEACLLREPAGLYGVEALVREVAAEHQRRSRHGADVVDEAAQRLRGKLLLDAPHATARLSQFEARGPLRGFLRTALVREVSTLVRQTRREVPLEDDDQTTPQSAGELAVLKHTYGPLASQAFKEAFAALPQQQQQLLQQVYAHGMTVDDLARVHQVHRATAARWVARARGDLGDATRGLLQQRLGLARQDADRMLDALQSSMSVSLGWTTNR